MYRAVSVRIGVMFVPISAGFPQKKQQRSHESADRDADAGVRAECPRHTAPAVGPSIRQSDIRDGNLASLSNSRSKLMQVTIQRICIHVWRCFRCSISVGSTMRGSARSKPESLCVTGSFRFVVPTTTTATRSLTPHGSHLLAPRLRRTCVGTCGRIS